MRKKRCIVAVAVALLLAGLAVVISLRQRAGPESARLLPEGDAVLYANIGRIRTIVRLGELAGGAVGPSSAASSISIDEPGYRRFVEETGFHLERDLDEVAMAVHALDGRSAAPAAAGGGDKVPAKPGQAPATSTEREYRFSEIFAGRFDSQRLAAYLKKISSGVERYGNNDIFIIPHEGRTVRVAILSVDLVAASNRDSASVIHGMVDRFHHSALPVEEPMLLRGYRSFLPTGAMVWAIFNAAPSRPRVGDAGIRLPSPAREWVAGSVVVASVTPGAALQLRAEVFTENPEAAKAIVNTATTYLTLYRAIETNVPAGGADPDVKTLFQTIRVEQANERVVVQASVTPAFLKKILSDTAPQPSAPAAIPKSAAQPPASGSQKPSGETLGKKLGNK